MDSAKRGGRFQSGILGSSAVAFGVLVFGLLSACGSANDYSSATLAELAAAQAGVDPNRSSSDFESAMPDELAFADDGVDSEETVATVGFDRGVGQQANGGSDGDRASLLNGADSEQGLLEPLTPDQDPTGASYQRCVVDYSGIDWNAPPVDVIEEHTAASTKPCTAQAWYEATAFQNGILVFMALTGEQNLVEASPSSTGAEETVTSLIAQGYAEVERMEIASTGACENGEIQLAILQLRPGVQIDPFGLDELLESADDVGALVDKRDGMTLIAGGGSPCVSGIVMKPGIVAWFTSSDATALVEAAQFLVQ